MSRVHGRSWLEWSILHRLILFCLALGLSGCDDVRPPAPDRITRSPGTYESPAQEVARLLAENKPFEFDFDLEDVAGNKLSKADLAGKVLIVDVWGTWCEPCLMEIPHFVELDKKYRRQGLQIVGLNDERGATSPKTATRVQNVCEKQGVVYPCAVITRKVMKQIPDLDGLPTTLFLDRTGTVRLKVSGYHDLSFLQAAVEHLLNEMGAENTDE